MQNAAFLDNLSEQSTIAPDYFIEKERFSSLARCLQPAYLLDMKLVLQTGEDLTCALCLEVRFTKAHRKR